jgi:hypothetical protein
MVAGIRVGSMVATRTISEDITVYNLKSDVNIYLFHWYRVLDEITSTYSNGKLLNATIKTSVGHKNYSSTVEWRKDHYEINIKGYNYSKTCTEANPITWSVARLYFEEPPYVAEIFSEDYGIFSEVYVIKPHCDQLVLLGKKDKFIYENNELHKADMQSTIKDFIIKAE